MLGLIGVAVLVFASTNVDDLFLLAAFFADRRLSARSVVLGQFLGIGALVAVSAVAAWLSLAVPEGYPALLGVIPLALGLKELWALRRASDADDDEGDFGDAVATSARAQVLAVGAVTVANGGDNLGTYIPLFARDTRLVPVYAVVFAAMTALWCFAGHRLVRSRAAGAHLRKHGRVMLPFVLIALGVWILSGTRVLLR